MTQTLSSSAENVITPDPAAFLAPVVRTFNYGLLGGEKYVLNTTKEFYYEDGARRYWMQNFAGEWRALPETNFGRELEIMGVRAYADVKGGETVSPKSRVISDVQMDRWVDYAGELAGYKPGFYKLTGERFLVTKGPDLIVPQRGEFPLLQKLTHNLLFDEERQIDQTKYLWAWIRQTLECLYSGEWAVPGALCLGICGPAHCGKTFLSDIVRVLFGGRTAAPFAFMAGQDSFNEEMYEAVLQLVDDQQTQTDLKARLHFAAQIKMMTAAGWGRMRGMQKKARSLRPLWRLMILCNNEIDRMQILPPLDDDVVDKLLLLRAYKKPFPFPLSTAAEKSAAWAALQAELPAFVWWLLKEWEMPAEVRGERFGVEAWQHPEIVDSLMETAPELQQWDFIERVMARAARAALDDNQSSYSDSALGLEGRLAARKALGPAAVGAGALGWTWKGSASELVGDLKRETSGLTRDEVRQVNSAVYLGRRLVRLGKVKPGGARFEFKNDGKHRMWTIRYGENAPE